MSTEGRDALLDHIKLHNIAAKVAGIGSAGTACGILLLMADERDPMCLRRKEARSSVLEPYAGKSRLAIHGERVAASQLAAAGRERGVPRLDRGPRAPHLHAPAARH